MPKLIDFFSGRMLQDMVCSALTLTHRTRYDLHTCQLLLDCNDQDPTLLCISSCSMPAIFVLQPQDSLSVTST